MTLGAETFDRSTEREGRLSKRGKAERERKKSGFWGYNWNKAYIGYCDGASFGGMTMMGMMKPKIEKQVLI